MPRCKTCGGADTKTRPIVTMDGIEFCSNDFHKDAPLPELQATRKRVLELEQEVAFLRAVLQDFIAYADTESGPAKEDFDSLLTKAQKALREKK